MKTTRKLLLALVLVMSILMTLAVAVIPASAANPSGTTLYLKPNSNWTQSNARFAVYLCNGSSTATWYSMSDSDGDGIYEVTIPSGRNDKNIIFCRMNGSTTANNWNNKWNQTGDLVWDGTNNLCTINDGQWDCGTNVKWSTLKYYVKGEFNNWGTSNPLEVNGNALTTTINIQAGTYAFKIMNTSDKWWSKSSTTVTDTTSALALTQNNGLADMTLKVTKCGAYTFTFASGKLTISRADADGAHTWNTGVETTAPTCEGTGVKTFTCEVVGCGETKTSTVDALGHDWTVKPTYDHDDDSHWLVCGNDGCNTANTTTAEHGFDHACDTTCDTCGFTREIKHDYNEGVVTTNPTCTDKGVKTFTCKVVGCGNTKTEEVSATGHNYVDGECDTCGDPDPDYCDHEYDYDCDKVCNKCHEITREDAEHDIKYVDAVAPTCNSIGNVEHWYCTICGSVWTDEALTETSNIQAVKLGNLEHTWDNACDTDCNRGCGYTRTITHEYDAVVTNPDCVNGGYTTYTCSVCGDNYVADEVAALGHSYTSSVTAPTCTDAGYTTYTCGACGDTYVADEVAKLGHDLVDVEGKDATCTEAGYTAYKDCSRCDHIEGKTEIPATGHNHVNNICTVCEHVEYIYIYFQNNWLWSDVKVYYWDANETHNANWPGANAEFVKNDGTYDIYLVKISTDFKATGIIFNGVKNDGSGKIDQTPDIKNFTTCSLYSMKWDNGNKVDVKVAHNHTESVTKQATCTEAGLKTFTCLCGDTYTEEIKATGHVNTTTNTENATCTNPGSTTVTCSCGHVVSTTEIPVDANAHYAGCGHYAVEGDSLQAALGNGSVELTKPVTVTGDLVITGGATLDLKGQTLTADAIVTFNGTIIDTVGTGKIIVNVDSETNKPMLQITKGNYKYAPIHVETKDGKSTYAITPVKVQRVTAELSNTAVVRPSLLGAQYTNKQLFADKVIDHGITFELLVTRDNGVDKPESATLNFTEKQIHDLFDDNKSAIKLTLVGGLEGYTYTVELVVKSANTMVHSTVVAIHYVPVTTPKVETEPETTND